MKQREKISIPAFIIFVLSTMIFIIGSAFFIKEINHDILTWSFFTAIISWFIFYGFHPSRFEDDE